MDIEDIAVSLQRTPSAVAYKARGLGLTGNSDAERMSMAELMKRTGRNSGVLRRVARKLGLNFRKRARTWYAKRSVRRTKRGTRYSISRDTAERIIEALRPLAGYDCVNAHVLGKWACEHDACIDCGTTERAHYAYGRCALCARRERGKAEGWEVPAGCTRLTDIASQYGKNSKSMQLAVKLAGVQLVHGKHVHYVRNEDVAAVQVVLDAARGRRLGHVPLAVWGADGRPEACVSCGRKEVPHQAKGLCRTCYARQYRKPKGV
jgi:hypothetical protein